MSLQMSDAPFEKRVETAFANPERVQATSGAAYRFFEGRERVLATLPDADATRDLGRAIRAHTIAHLDQYLTQFEANLQAAGGQVHWARDSAEAQAIVKEIAEQHGGTVGTTEFRSINHRSNNASQVLGSAGDCEGDRTADGQQTDRQV